MSETVLVAVIVATAGLFGTIVGGLITYVQTSRKLQYDKETEQRERELRALIATFDSVLQIEGMFDRFYLHARMATEMGQPWGEVEQIVGKREIERAPMEGQIALTVAIFAPHLTQHVTDIASTRDDFIGAVFRGVQATSQPEREAALGEMATILERVGEATEALRQGLADAARAHFN